MKRQLNYIYTKDLGYNYETVVSVPLYPDPSSQRLSEFISSGMANGELLKEKLDDGKPRPPGTPPFYLSTSDVLVEDSWFRIIDENVDRKETLNFKKSV